MSEENNTAQSAPQTPKKGFKLTKSWQYLIYLYLALPGLLFLLAWLTRNSGLAEVFHGYNLYVINTVPDLPTLTGIVGIALAAWFLFDAARHRRWVDLAVSAALVAADTVYFAMDWNYLLLRFLSFAQVSL